ncbi:unnamed protein product [Parnassius mnemosyne]|uniref:Protein takeout n=1 Tax=Parnassius mnemosyne TaxID=213953 RepID=A0AAV1KSR2_9NEOP
MFQQDSAPAHRARSTQNWLTARGIDFIGREDWPSSSPDLNPLDYKYGKIWRFENNEADITLHCDILIKGKYKANGQILIVSLNGDGDAKLKITDVLLKAKLKFADKVRDGVTHYDVKHYKVSYMIRDKVHFDLTNLFKGNPEISQTVLTFLNENWKEVVNEFGGPIVDFVINLAFKNVQQFFKKIPKDELIDV